MVACALKERLIFPRMYATNDPSRCPVTCFELYKFKRPGDLKNKGPLFLTPIVNPLDDNVWYKHMRLGVNTLNNMMKSIIKNSSLSSCGKKLTNHSARKTVVKKLKSAGIQKCEI